MNMNACLCSVITYKMLLFKCSNFAQDTGVQHLHHHTHCLLTQIQNKYQKTPALLKKSIQIKQ